MKIRSRVLCISAAVAAALYGGGQVNARNLTWDSNGPTAPLGQDGGGNWDLTSQNWVSGDLITGTNTTWLNSPADSAIFGNGTNAYVPEAPLNVISVTDAIVAQDITLGLGTNGAGYNLQDGGGSLAINGNVNKTALGGALQIQLGGPITLGTGAHIFALHDTPGDAAPELSINTELTGTGGVTLDNVGAGYEAWGSLAFNIDNTYTGVTNIASGRLIITTSGALGATGAGQGTVISSTGSLAFGTGGPVVGGGITTSEPITITRDTYTGGQFGNYPYALSTGNGSGTHTLNGALVIDSTDARLSVNTSTLDIAHAITEGATVAAGTSMITFTGDYAGFVKLTANNSAYPGTFRLLDHVEVQPVNQNAIGGPSSKILFAGDATLQPPPDMVNFGTHVIDYAHFNGGLDIPAGQTFTVDHAITGGAGLGQRGAGTLNINSPISGNGFIFWDGVTPGGAKNGIINVNAAVTMGSLHLRSPIVNINSGGSVTTNAGYNQIGADSGGTNGTPDIAVVNLNGTGQLIQTSGDDFNISDNANTQGTINVHNNAVLTTGGITFLAKATGAIGTINQDGGTVNINRGGNFGLVLGDGRNSQGPQGNYNMSGGTLNVTGEMYVGEGRNSNVSAVGSFNVSGNSTVNLSNWFVVGREGGVGTVSFSGGIINHTGGNVSIGDSAGGTNSMTMSGTANFNSTAGEFWVGTGGGSVSNVIVKDNATLGVTDWFAIGRGGAFGTLDISGNATVTKTGGNNSYVGESTNAVTSTMTVRGNGKFTASSGEFWAGQGGGIGILNIQDNAGFTVSNWLAVGRADGNSKGTVNISGGTLTKTAGSGGYLAIGSGGQGTLNQTGGTMIISGTRIGEASSGTANLSAGVATFTDEFSVGFNDGLTGTLNISGSANVTVPGVVIGVNSNGANGGTINLNGGTLTGASFIGGASATAARNFNFNGGLLKPSGASSNFIGAKIASNIFAGGAKIDTNGFDIATGSAFNHGGGTPDGGLAKSGAGKLTMNGANSFTGPTSVTAGTLALGSNLTTSSSLTISNSTVQLLSNGTNSRVIKAPTLSITAGKLDLTDNKLITGNPVGSATGGTYNGVSGLIQAGRNGGGWGGNGIVTSQTQATTGNFTSLGVATASQAKGIAATATAVFAGQTVSGSDTLVMYTYGGDANLDGKINVDDYTRIDFNVPLGVAGWYNGDFNYDGKINVDDYTIIDFNVGIQGAAFPTATGAAEAGGLNGVTAVPEPASLSLVALGAASLLGRRRRRESAPAGTVK